MSYASILDIVNKAAACVGLILGLSYAAGLFRVLGLCLSLKAGWLFDLMDVQMFINAGLPMVMLSMTAMIMVLCILRDKMPFKRQRSVMVLGIVLSCCAVWMIVPYLGLVGGDNKLRILTVMVLLVGSVIIGWGIHSYLLTGESKSSLVGLFIAASMILIAAPMIEGYVQADDIKYARDTTTEVVDGSNNVVGILVRVIGGKYLVMDCRVKYQMSMLEPSPDVRLRVSSGRCKALF